MERSDELPVGFRDLPAAAYPLVVEYSTTDGTVIQTVTVDGPGVLVVPALREKHGPISVRIRFADGDVVETHPDE